MDETRPIAYVSTIYVIKYIETWILNWLAYFDIDFSFELQVSH